jgi:hypothetical protein
MMRKKQRGMTMISWVIILGLVGIQLIAAMRIIPVYLDYSSVKQIMEEVKVDSSSHGAAPPLLMSMIGKRLDVNGMYELQQNKDAFTFQKIKDGMKVSLHYEVRRPVYGNLEFIATFDHEVDIPNQ